MKPWRICHTFSGLVPFSEYGKKGESNTFMKNFMHLPKIWIFQLSLCWPISGGGGELNFCSSSDKEGRGELDICAPFWLSLNKYEELAKYYHFLFWIWFLSQVYFFFFFFILYTCPNTFRIQTFFQKWLLYLINRSATK